MEAARERDIAIRDAFGQAMVEFGTADERIVVVDPDLGNGTGASLFADAVPERYFQVGIAEQNAVGVAAGLAASGYLPFVVTFAAFAATRCLDQIRVSVAQPQLPVVIVGGHAGMLAGRLGKTHVCMEDLAIFRALPGIAVVAPADGVEMRAVVRFAIDNPGPLYLRSGRDPTPVIFDDDFEFELGRARLIKEGDDVAFISTGTQTPRALEAATMLSDEGISASVLHVATIKPLDREAIVSTAGKARVTVTCEDHSVNGGLGSAVAELLSEHSPSPVLRIGTRDTYIESARNEALLEKHGLAPARMADTVKGFLDRHGRPT